MDKDKFLEFLREQRDYYNKQYADVQGYRG